jgi:hypothetical protein
MIHIEHSEKVSYCEYLVYVELLLEVCYFILEQIVPL